MSLIYMILAVVIYYMGIKTGRNQDVFISSVENVRNAISSIGKPDSEPKKLQANEPEDDGNKFYT